MCSYLGGEDMMYVPMALSSYFAGDGNGRSSLTALFPRFECDELEAELCEDDAEDDPPLRLPKENTLSIFESLFLSFG